MRARTLFKFVKGYITNSAALTDDEKTNVQNLRQLVIIDGLLRDAERKSALLYLKYFDDLEKLVQTAPDLDDEAFNPPVKS